MPRPGEFWWLSRPGLAGGIDKTGERAAELLDLGFGSVEFGSVTVQPLPGSNPGLTALVERLATLLKSAVGPGATESTAGPRTIGTNAGPRTIGTTAGPRTIGTTAGPTAIATIAGHGCNPEKRARTAVGIGLGLPPDLPPEALAGEWLQAMQWLAMAPPVVDYLSLNLSAAANRRFVGEALQPVLRQALAAVGRWRADAAGPALAVKLPVEAVPALMEALRAAGVGQLTVVLSDLAGPVANLAHLRQACALAGTMRVVAVGSIRCAADRRAALDAGCAGVQVHRLFVAQGSATAGLLTG